MRHLLAADIQTDLAVENNYPGRDEVTCEEPTADGGYPVDGDLHQMTDYGCPLTPNPARWIDPEWRDEPDASDDPAVPVPQAVSTEAVPVLGGSTRWWHLVSELETRARWSACCARVHRDEASELTQTPGAATPA